MERREADGVYKTLIEQWNGASWGIVASPSPGATGNLLFGVAGVSSKNVWAMGTYASANGANTLVERYSKGK